MDSSTDAKTEASTGLGDSSITRTAPALVTVIIPNHNYGDFVGAAIDSALALDWPAVEVIVVDDGSSDHSRQVISAYGERVLAVFQDNSGQSVACNTGFAKSSGEIIIFLDSDDLLEPTLIKDLMAVWRPGISKVQFQMQFVDADGKATGDVFPHYHVVPSAAQVRRWARTAAAYPTPPGSGNAYSRSFLRSIFPLDGQDRASDTYCLAAAPYLGDVLTIAKPLVMYRVHGRNQGARSRLSAARFSVDVRRAQFRFRYGQAAAHTVGIPVDDSALQRSLTFLPYRLASLKLSPSTHPIGDDTVPKVLTDLVFACFTPQGVPVRSRAALCVWATSVALAPSALGSRLLLWRFAPSSRPDTLKRAMRALGILRRTTRAEPAARTRGLWASIQRAIGP
ncbi:MAG TPA: glycosyltransferase family 2 protein [Polyangiaceae bacterium]|nr:glycosyltransferase family 2 protein [Polyangiaceae bacterium]